MTRLAPLLQRQVFREPDEHLPTLYDRTGRITDINTLLVGRNELRSLYPWWTKLQIRLRNWSKHGRFVLHFAAREGGRG